LSNLESRPEPRFDNFFKVVKSRITYQRGNGVIAPVLVLSPVEPTMPIAQAWEDE